MSLSTSTPWPWSRKRIRSSPTGRIASGSSWTVTPSCRRYRGRLPSTWLAEWISDSPNAPWDTMRIPTMEIGVRYAFLIVWDNKTHLAPLYAESVPDTNFHGSKDPKADRYHAAPAVG